MIRRFAGALVVLALVATGCRASRLKIISGAPAAVKKQGSVKTAGTMAFAFKGAGQDSSFTMKLDGVQQFDPQLGRITISFEEGSPFAAAGPQEVLLGGGYSYLTAPPCPSGALGNKLWVRYDPFKAFGINPNSVGSNDPTSYLEALKGAGEVRETGKEDVQGVSTTRYNVKIDREKLLQTVAAQQREMFEQMFTDETEISTDVWIDDEDLPRKFLMKLSGAGAQMGLESFEMTFTMEFSDYGTKVEVEIPSEDQVTTIDSPQALSTMCQGGPPPATAGSGASGY